MRNVAVLGFVLAGCSQKAEPTPTQLQPVQVVCSCAPPPAVTTPPCSEAPATQTPSPSPSPTANGAAPSSNVEKAREAALRDEPATVRKLLEEKVRNGKGTPEENNLVRQACRAMGDKSCSDDIKKRVAPPIGTTGIF